MPSETLLAALYEVFSGGFSGGFYVRSCWCFALCEGLTAGYLTVVVSAVVSNKIDLADSQ